MITEVIIIASLIWAGCMLGSILIYIFHDQFIGFLFLFLTSCVAFIILPPLYHTEQLNKATFKTDACTITSDKDSYTITCGGSQLKRTCDKDELGQPRCIIENI